MLDKATRDPATAATIWAVHLATARFGHANTTAAAAAAAPADGGVLAPTAAEAGDMGDVVGASTVLSDHRIEAATFSRYRESLL